MEKFKIQHIAFGKKKKKGNLEKISGNNIFFLLIFNIINHSNLYKYLQPQRNNLGNEQEERRERLKLSVISTYFLFIP